MIPEVRCLPVAGTGNPYQKLMMKGLAEGDRLKVGHGTDGAFFAATRTCHRYRPDYLHYDWINSYARKRNRLLSYLNLPLFALDLLIVKYFYPGTQIVWTLHNVYPHTVAVESWHKYVRLFFYQQTKWVRVFSKDTTSRFMSFYKTNDNRFIVVPEGSYKTVYPTPLSEKEESIVREASDAPEGLRLLHLGRLYPYKGLEELISVFREWPGDHTLTLAGKPIDEAYATMLRKATEMDSRIRFIPGFVSETDLPAYYANADVAVLPFINIENSGSVIMAMGYGKPVLAPAIGVLKDRLCSQRELLYNVEDGIKGGLNKLSTLKAKQLIVWGQANSAALDQYQWRDFQRVFLNDNHPH